MSALIIRTLCLFSLFTAGCLSHAAPAYATGEDVVLASAEAGDEVSVDLSQALANGKPTMILFMPVEMCQIRYCIQPAQIAHQLEQQYPDEINLVIAPVYAIDTPVPPEFPMIDWPIYLVEPFATWAPEIEQTPFGWGISTPEMVLVTPDGAVIDRSREFWPAKRVRFLSEAR